MEEEEAWTPEQLQIIRHRMSSPTSRSDILYMLKNQVNVIPYEKLAEYTDIDEVLGQHKAAVLLYPNARSPDPRNPIGHWVAIFEQEGAEVPTLQYFDSYGCFIDHPVDKYNEDAPDLQKQQIDDHLRKLVLESKYRDNWRWNDYPFQGDNRTVRNTCGLWAAVRILNKDMDEEEFKQTFLEEPMIDNVDPDLAISAFIIQEFPRLKLR